LSTIRAVKRLKDAGPFLFPVDPVKLNIPTYLDVVKNPMDLGTIEKKLVDEQYTSIQDFINDVELIVANCTSFNGPDSFVTNMVKNVKASFDKHMAHLPPVDVPPPPPHKQKKKSLAPVNTPPKSQRVAAAQAAAAAQQQQEQQQQQQEGENSEPKPFALQPSGIPTIRRDSSVDSGRPKREIHPPKSRDLPYGDIKPRKKKFAAELRFCGQVLKELQSKKHEAYSFPFLQPVDPVALNCPTYFKIIKQPMDLSTVYDKLQTNRYETAEEFFTDVKLIFKNCYKFNVEGSAVNVMGHKLEQVFDKLWADKPVQPPTPPPQADFSDFDDSDFDEDAAIAAAMNNPAIRYMEQQLAKMQADLDQMRRDVIREAKEKRRKPSSTKKGRRKSGVKDSSAKRKSSTGPGKRPRSNSNEKEIQVTYEMKQELTDKIGELPEKKLHRVVAIIQESLPNLNNGSDEIELDIDQLDTQTIIKLYNFVVRKDENSSSSKPTKKSSTTKRKSRPLTEDEQNRQIQELQDKLKQFDQAAGGAAQDEQQESSSDEDDQESDESSEEE
jgi:bromodomain-containing factor 1